MTPEAQRIAIAEACGWTYRHCMSPDGINYTEAYAPNGRMAGNTSGHHGLHANFGLPDYLNDLNAMWDVEQGLPVHHWTRYVQWLATLAQGTRRFVVAHATAAQRAEAFLRTIGKWVD